MPERVRPSFSLLSCLTLQIIRNRSASTQVIIQAGFSYTKPTTKPVSYTTPRAGYGITPSGRSIFFCWTLLSISAAAKLTPAPAQQPENGPPVRVLNVSHYHPLQDKRHAGTRLFRPRAVPSLQPGVSVCDVTCRPSPISSRPRVPFPHSLILSATKTCLYWACSTDRPLACPR